MNEYVQAGGYVGVSLLILRGFDVLVKWQAGRGSTTASELETVRKANADLIASLRQQLEDARRREVELETKLDIAEKALLELKAVHAETELALRDSEYENRAWRAADKERRIKSGESPPPTIPAVGRRSRLKPPPGEPEGER